MTELDKALEQIQSGQLPENIEIEQDGYALSPDQVSQSRSAMLQWIMTASLVGQAVKIRKLLEAKYRRESFEGKMDPRRLNATAVRQEVQAYSWVSMFVINYGPDTAYFALNTPHNWLEIQAAQTRTISLLGAESRIDRIFYRCDPGSTALLIVDGEY